MKKLLLIGVLAAAVAVPSAGAAGECNGLDVCVSVPGPWVAVGPGSAPVHYGLSCPASHIVAGLDVRLTQSLVDVVFLGKTGSLVAPGVTTERAAVFVATYLGTARRTAGFRPFLGCVPTQGGGRSTTGRSAPEQGVPPRAVAQRRIKDFRVQPGRVATIRYGCGRRERLVSSSHAVAFRSARPPAANVLAAVRVKRTHRGGSVVAQVDARAIPRGTRVEVQLHALCVRRAT